MKPSKQNWIKHRRATAWSACGLAGVLLSLLATSCKREPSAESDASSVSDPPIAITIGEREVSLFELQAELDHLQSRQHPISRNREVFIESTVERLIAVEKAKELGLHQDPELRRQWENLLIGKLKREAIQRALDDVSVDELELETYYNENLDRYTQAGQVHLAMLYLSVPTSADDSQRESIYSKMAEARELALALPADTHGFGSMAMKYSEEATSRFKGGDIGWLKQGLSQYRWPNEVIESAFMSADVDILSDIISCADGYYLLKRIDSRDPIVRPLNRQLAHSLESELLKQKRQARQEEISASWAVEYSPTLNDETISKLKFASQPSAASQMAAQPFPAAK